MPAQDLNIERNLMLVHPWENEYAFPDGDRSISQTCTDDILIVRSQGKRCKSNRAHDLSPQLSHPFLAFVNARTLPDMLNALDQCFGEHDEGFFDKESEILYPERLKPVDEAEALAEIFYKHRKATPAEKKDIEDALRCWSARGTDIEACASACEGHTLPIASLNDLVDAKNDLYNHALALAYYAGKVDRSEVFDDNDSFRFPRIKPDLRRCIKARRLKDPFILPDLELFYWDRHKANEAPYPDRSSSSHAEDWYLEEIFNANSEPETAEYLHIETGSRIGHTLTLVRKPLHACLLSQMWGFIRDGMCKERGIGSIQVCPQCKRLFLQTESSKRKYCSRSCNSGAAQQRSREQSAESER